MFAAGSIEELANHYRNHDGVVVSGVWSVLITRSAEQSADFARRYFDLFNGVVRGGWHLAVYAGHFHKDGKDQWTASPELHQHVENIRNQIVDDDEEVQVPPLCAVFFDPNVGAFNNRSVIIPFDQLQLANEALFKDGFVATHECIMRAFNAKKLDPYGRVPAELANGLLEEFHKQLKKRSILTWLTKPLAPLGNAALGALLGKI